DWQLYSITYLVNVGFVFFPSWFFQGIERLTQTAIFNFFTKLIFAAIVIILIKEENDFSIYVLGISLSQITVGIIAFVYCIYRYKIKIIAISLRRVFFFLKQGGILFLSSITINLYTTTNLILLGFFTSELEYGYFSAALKIALVTHSLIIIPLGITLFPHITKKINQSKEEGLRTLLKYLRWVSIATFIMSSFIFFFAEELIVLLFGSKFLSGIYFLKIMAFMPFVSGINNILSVQGLLNLRKEKEYLYITIGTLFLSLLLNFLLLPKYGAMGTAIIQLSCEVFMVLLAAYCLFMIKRKMR
ncbi:MAG: oligosaccharide flippase family protein, partial [Nanoarchaeota archaeon]